MDWEAVRSTASVISALCAIVAALVSVAVYRKARSSDLGARIETGDKSVKAHADSELSAMRTANAQAIAKIEDTCTEMRDELTEVGKTIARIEAHQETESDHVLRPVDLGKIHEKINSVALEVAAVRAQSQTETRMLSEQLKVIQNMLLSHYGSKKQ